MSTTDDDKDNVVPFDPTKRRPKKSDDGDGPRNIDDFLRTLKMVRDPSGRIFGVFGPELIPADTQKFLDRISWDYHQRTRKVTSRQQIEKALAVVRGNPEIRSSVVPCRYGYDSAGAVWLDGVTHAVKIDEKGVSVHEKAPFAFFRPEGVQQHPRPAVPKTDVECTESLNLLWTHLQLDRQGRRVAFSWLVAAMRPTTKVDGDLMRYPILAVTATHGGGKTSKVDTIRGLADLRLPLHCDLPSDGRNLAILGENQHVLSFDNVSTISPAMSDGLCRRATGDAFESREYYTTRGLSNLRGSNPVIINTIVDTIFHAPDLQSRALLLNLPPIRRRLADEKVAKNFRGIEARVQGALYYCVSRALRDLKQVVPAPSDIRMASAATFAIAAASAAGFSRSDIIKAYRRTRLEADAIALDRSFPMAFMKWLRRQKAPWRGSAETLLGAVRPYREDDYDPRSNDFPKNGNGVRSALKRLEPVLRRAGVSFNWKSEGSRRNGRNFAIWLK